jgi:hypothetical protein
VGVVFAGGSMLAPAYCKKRERCAWRWSPFELHRAREVVRFVREYMGDPWRDRYFVSRLRVVREYVGDPRHDRYFAGRLRFVREYVGDRNYLSWTNRTAMALKWLFDWPADDADVGMVMREPREHMAPKCSLVHVLNVHHHAAELKQTPWCANTPTSHAARDGDQTVRSSMQAMPSAMHGTVQEITLGRIRCKCGRVLLPWPGADVISFATRQTTPAVDATTCSARGDVQTATLDGRGDVHTGNDFDAKVLDDLDDSGRRRSNAVPTCETEVDCLSGPWWGAGNFVPSGPQSGVVRSQLAVGCVAANRTACCIKAKHVQQLVLRRARRSSTRETGASDVALAVELQLDLSLYVPRHEVWYDNADFFYSVSGVESRTPPVYCTFHPTARETVVGFLGQLCAVTLACFPIPPTYERPFDFVEGSDGWLERHADMGRWIEHMVLFGAISTNCVNPRAFARFPHILSPERWTAAVHHRNARQTLARSALLQTIPAKELVALVVDFLPAEFRTD